MPKIVKSPLTVIVVLLAFTLASFWSLIAWKGTQERAAAFAKAGSETQGLTHSLAQHASKSFNAVALALFGARQYIQHSDRSARASASSATGPSPPSSPPRARTPRRALEFVEDVDEGAVARRNAQTPKRPPPCLPHSFIFWLPARSW